MFLCSAALFKEEKKKQTLKDATSANTMQHASLSHALSLGKQNLIQFGPGDATGGSAVWMQTPNSCRRDIKREKNSM